MVIWCFSDRSRHTCRRQSWGPSIKYVTLFLVNCYPPPSALSHFVTHPWTPRKYVTHLGPPRFLEGLAQKTRTKAPLYKLCFNCSRGFFPVGFVMGSFDWKV